MQPNAVFCSVVDRKPYEQLSNDDAMLLTTRTTSTSGSMNQTQNPFKMRGKDKISNMMFGTRDESVELMMQNSTSMGSTMKTK